MPAKFKLNSIQVLIYKALIDGNISHDEFASINNVLKEYDKINQKFNKLFSLKKIFCPFIKQCHRIVWGVE